MCPPGKSSSATNANMLAYCTFCPSGQDSSAANGATCANCTAGKYRGSGEESGCTFCPGGQEASANRATCAICTAGKYRGSGEESGCTDCAAGLITENVGSISAAQCVTRIDFTAPYETCNSVKQVYQDKCSCAAN